MLDAVEHCAGVGAGRNGGGRVCCVCWLDYDVVEGTGAVLPCRQYIEAAGREMDEESGRGFQCRLFSLA